MQLCFKQNDAEKSVIISTNFNSLGIRPYPIPLLKCNYLSQFSSPESVKIILK